MNTTTIKKGVAAGALLLSGLAIGGMAAGRLSASAATNTVTSTVASTAQLLDPTKSIRSDEHLLTGTTAGDQVIVQVGKDVAVTGTRTGGGPGGGAPAPATTTG